VRYLISISLFLLLVPQASADSGNEKRQLMYDVICHAMQTAADVGYMTADKNMEASEVWERAGPTIFEATDKYTTEAGKDFYRLQARKHFERGYEAWPDSSYAVRLYDACMGWHEERYQPA
jgi:hypothetical protein